jgi:hypothetical protein
MGQQGSGRQQVPAARLLPSAALHLCTDAATTTHFFSKQHANDGACPSQQAIPEKKKQFTQGMLP